MEEKSKIDKDLLGLEVSLELTDFAEGDKLPSMAVYLFDSSGQLLEKKAISKEQIKNGKIKEVFKVKSTANTLVKVGPALEDPKRLSMYRTISSNVGLKIERSEKEALNLVIPTPIWKCWIRYPYSILGSVETDKGIPVCYGNVDIYDVDIELCFSKLSDDIIERLRDALIDIIIDPPRISDKYAVGWPDWDDDFCGTPPWKWPWPHPSIDIVSKLNSLPPEFSFAKQRYEGLASSRKKMESLLGKMPTIEKSSYLNIEAVRGVTKSQVLYTNSTQFREILTTNFQAFRYYLCWYPWVFWLWWPWCWWYGLEKLGTASLNSDGSFSLTISRSVCDSDVPDLWFVVSQKVNGIDKVVYAKHPLPCNTFWNHASGDPVKLIVTDPEAYICNKNPDVVVADPSGLWVLPLAIGNYSLYNVYGTGPALSTDSAKAGLYKSINTGLSGSLSTFMDGPFGGKLGLRLLFSPVLELHDIKYYRIKYRKNGTGDWTPLDSDVFRHYSYYDSVSISLEFKPYKLGPQSKGTESMLYEIPPLNTPLYPDPLSHWYVTNATVDLMNGYFNSIEDASRITSGFVEFKIELFDKDGKRFDPASKGIKFKLPSNNNILGTITTVDPTFNSTLLVDDPETHGFQVFMFRLQIDNSATIASIDPPVVLPSGAAAGDDCGMISYAATDATVEMKYKAFHPQKFAMYSFTVSRGYSQQWNATGQVSKTDDFEMKVSIPDLLKNCPAAVFSENLYVWHMNFNGWSRVGPDASDVRAFALTPKK
jgi:hypothetical protein